MWMRTSARPQVQAEQAVNYGETPDNKLACAYMDKIQAGSCAQYHANAPLSYFKSIALWKTPHRHLRQRQVRLRALRRLGIRVEYPGQMTGQQPGVPGGR